MPEQANLTSRPSIHDFLKAARFFGFHPTQFLLPTALSLLAAVCDAISMALLIPLAKGIIEKSFVFLDNVPVLGFLFAEVNTRMYFPNSAVFAMLIAIIFTCAILKNVFLYFSHLTTSSRTETLLHQLRSCIFERYLKCGKLFFDRTNFGHLSQVLLSAPRDFKLLFLTFPHLLTSIFTLLLYLGIMLLVSWKFTILICVAFPAMFFSLRYLIHRIRTISVILAESLKRMHERAFNILSCIILVKEYAHEKSELKTFLRLSEEERALRIRSDRFLFLLEPIQESIGLVVLLLMISITALFIFKFSGTSVAGFLVCFVIARKAFTLFPAFNKTRSEFAKMYGSIHRIFDIFDDGNKFMMADGTKTFSSLERGIELKQLTFSYVSGVDVVKGISCFIPKGKMTAIVGPSGSGKTTLIQLISRFYEAPPASIFIDGQDVRDFTFQSLRSSIAIVSQDALLFNDSLRANLDFGLNGKVTEEVHAEVMRKARLKQLLDQLPDGLETLIGDRGVKLSGGEKQRVSIARAMLKGSEILILDEATSSLDTLTERLVQEAINEVVKGKTSIVIAHRLSTIRHADKILVIEDGRLVEEGPLDFLLEKRGKFYEYWRAQKFDESHAYC
jgi:ATP-binding cassette, subfamily B, bacterial MsbA